MDPPKVHLAKKVELGEATSVWIASLRCVHGRVRRRIKTGDVSDLEEIECGSEAIIKQNRCKRELSF